MQSSRRSRTIAKPSTSSRSRRAIKLKDDIVKFVKKFEVYVENEAQQELDFERELEVLLLQDEDLFRDSILASLASEIPDLWIGLISKNLNFNIATYLQDEHGVFNNRPENMWRFIELGTFSLLEATNSDADPRRIYEWHLLKMRVGTLIMWFVEDLGVSPNSLVKVQNQYGSWTGSEMSVISLFLARTRSQMVTNTSSFVLQSLLDYGGEIFQPMELNNSGTYSYNTTVLRYICDEQDLPLDENWQLNSDGWIAVSLEVQVKNDMGIFSDEQIESIQKIILPTGRTIAQEADLYRTQNQGENGGYNLLMDCCRAALRNESMVVMEQLRIFPEGLLTYGMGSIIPRRYIPPQSDRKTNVVNFALQHGALETLSFLTQRGFMIPDESFILVRPDLESYLKEHLYLFGVSKERIAILKRKWRN